MPSQKQSSDQLAQMPIDQFYQTVASSDNGLSADQVKTQEAKYGPDVITAAKGQNKLWQF